MRGLGKFRIVSRADWPCSPPASPMRCGPGRRADLPAPRGPARRTGRRSPWPDHALRGAQQAKGLRHVVVVLDRTGQQLAQPIRVGAGFAQGIEHGQRVHTLAQIGAGQLAGFVWVAVDVDDVVGDLERRADDATEPAQPLDLLLVGARERRTEPAGGRDQAGGLLVHHLEVVLDGVDVLGGPAGFAHLPRDQLREGVGDDAHRLRAQPGHQPRGRREQVVAGQNRDVVAPPRVGARRPRRTCASSITSSWYSVARCTSSMTAPATVTCQASGSGPSRADSTVNNGRNRLPPAWNRC